MGNPDSMASRRIGNVRWTICAMLFAATTINYMDRQVLALLKPTLMQSVAGGGIGLTEESYGTVIAYFTAFYAFGQLGAGRLVDKVGTRIGYMLIMAVWSISAIGHSLVNSVLQLGIARASLGLGESGNFPAANKTNAEWFPRKERSLSFGIFNCGANVGVILATLLVPIAVHYFGWHSAFLITGFFSASWIFLWFLKYHKPAEHPALSTAELDYINQDPPENKCTSTPWIKLFGLRQTWAYAIPKFLTDPIWWFYLYWLPGYFSDKFHLSLIGLGLPILIVYNASAIGSIYGGYLPATFIRLGFTAERARMIAMFLCACLVAPVFLINYLQADNFGKWAAIGLLSMAAAAHQGWSCNLFTTASDMFPRSAVGSVTGIGTMAGAVSGFLFAKFIGHILQLSHGNYSILFILAASVYLFSLLIAVLLAPGMKKVELSA
jgi:ACS family hexuronate transporter-like MFS transporter